jgi:hypothetical protein
MMEQTIQLFERCRNPPGDIDPKLKELHAKVAVDDGGDFYEQGLERIHGPRGKKMMIDRSHSLPVTRQCQLLGLNRSSVYYQPTSVSDGHLRLMRRIDEMHLKRPFYGSRRIRDWLVDEGLAVNRKRVMSLLT